MKRMNMPGGTVGAALGLFMVLIATNAIYGSLSELHTSGTNIFNASNTYVHFTGEDIGGWLVTENWMCPTDNSGLYPDMYSIIHELDSRFGVSTEQSMISSYQSDWITASDLQNIKNRGDDCIRVPVWWGDFYPLSALGSTSPTLRSDAFTKLDGIVNECSSIGLYVVIDMHGVFGGQSTSQDCGHENYNAYWTNCNDQGNTALLWWEIANHYNGNGAVAGYDLINEPTGAPSTSAVWTAYNNLYNTVRSADPNHMIFMEGTFGSWDWSMLPAPSTYGWTNVVYEMHEYQNGGDTAQVETGAQN
jgi:endoglucanase